MGLYAQARALLEELEEEGARLVRLGLEQMLDHQTGVSSGGGLESVVRHVCVSERLKCLWGEERLEDCLEVALGAWRGVDTAREYMLRCWLELQAYDRVIAWCFENASVSPWSATYAACAMIRGRAVEEGCLLASAPANASAESQLRLAFEWAIHGDVERATEHARRALGRCDPRDEVSAMLGYAVLTVLSDIPSADTEKSLWDLLETSLHTPVRLACIAAILDGRASEASAIFSALLSCVDERLKVGESSSGALFVETSENVGSWPRAAQLKETATASLEALTRVRAPLS
jgi:hypothetical protein